MLLFYIVKRKCDGIWRDKVRINVSTLNCLATQLSWLLLLSEQHGKEISQRVSNCTFHCSGRKVNAIVQFSARSSSFIWQFK